jgi:hypothetical protein
VDFTGYDRQEVDEARVVALFALGDDGAVTRWTRSRRGRAARW